MVSLIVLNVLKVFKQRSQEVLIIHVLAAGCPATWQASPIWSSRRRTSRRPSSCWPSACSCPSVLPPAHRLPAPWLHSHLGGSRGHGQPHLAQYSHTCCLISHNVALCLHQYPWPVRLQLLGFVVPGASTVKPLLLPAFTMDIGVSVMDLP